MNMIWIFLILAILVTIAAWVVWPRIKGWFLDSETLFWARLQMLFGSIMTVVSVSDLAPVLGAFGIGKWAPVAFIATGVITELARKSRTVGGGDLTPRPDA